MQATRFVVAASAALLCAITGRAGADAARAWSAAKDNLPAQTALVIGADLTAITKSKTFGQFMPLLFAKEPELKKAFDTIKASCKIDPTSAIEGVVIATGADRKEGAVYLSLAAGLDGPKLTKCLEDVAKASGAKDPKVVTKKTGAITEVTIDKEKIYVGWIGADVLVIPSEPKTKAAVEKWIGQKGGLGKSPLAKIHGAANTKGAVWGAWALTQELEPGVKMKSGHGALTIGGGNLAAEVQVTLDSAKAATDAAAKANKQITDMTGSGQLPANVQSILKGVSVKAAGPAVSVKAAVPEAEVLPLLKLIGP